MTKKEDVEKVLYPIIENHPYFQSIKNLFEAMYLCGKRDGIGECQIKLTEGVKHDWTRFIGIIYSR